MFRILRRVLILLLLGAVINVVVAWLTVPKPQAVRKYDSFFFRYSGSYFTAGWWRTAWVDRFVMSPGWITIESNDTFSMPRPMPAWWPTSSVSASLQFVVKGGTAEVTVSGWPLRSFTGGWADASLRKGGTTIVHAIRLEDERLLPFNPIWHGVFVNSAVYAALTWTLVLMPLTWRRVRRDRRGLCRECGYDLHGTEACSECGWGHAV